jgi:hypothetical protein
MQVTRKELGLRNELNTIGESFKRFERYKKLQCR